MSNSFASAIRRTLFGLGTAGDAGDGRLLERFALEHDQASFEELVRRHGPMVLRVCRRVLRQPQDAEDAFQATFVVLARKAEAVAQIASVAAWLHKVAFRIALRARANADKRRAQQGAGLTMDVPAPAETSADPEQRELRSLLDEEVDRLPERYRMLVVLCYLEGKTNSEAAAQLGWPMGTIASRLSRARDLLRSRLGRRGLVLSEAVLASLVAKETASATVPALLAQATLAAATSGKISPHIGALAGAGLRTLVPFKARWAVIGLLLVLLGSGAVLLTKAKPAGTGTTPIRSWQLADTKLMHDAPVYGVACSADGKTVATASIDHSVRLWDTVTGRMQRRIEHTEALVRVALTADGGTVAAADVQALLCWWDTRTGKEMGRLQMTRAAVLSLDFTPDGSRIRSTDWSGEAVHWDLARGRRLGMTIDIQPRDWLVAVPSPDGKRFVLGRRHGMRDGVRIYDVETRTSRVLNRQNQFLAQTTLFTPDSRFVVIGALDGAVELWDAPTGRQIATLSSYVGPFALFNDTRNTVPFDRRYQPPLQAVTALACTSDYLACGMGDGAVRLCRLPDLTEEQVLPLMGNCVRSVALTSDGRTLIVGGDSHIVRLWKR